MEIFSWIALIVLGLLMVALSVLFPMAIGKNLKNGHQFREKLGERLRRTPMGRMLDKVGVGQSTYLHQEDSIKLHQQLANCDDCSSSEKCTSDLDGEKSLNADEIGYCPNQSAIKKLSD